MIKELIETMFGYEINPSGRKKEKQDAPSFVEPDNMDGARLVDRGAAASAHLFSADPSVATEFDLIQTYRSIALYPEIDNAIEEIANESIVNDETNQPIEINLDQVEATDAVKTAIKKEFNQVLRLMHFNTRGYEIFRKWYVDSRLVYHKVIDPQRPSKGIKELRPIDPKRVMLIKEVQKVPDQASGANTVKVIDEYFMYFPSGMSTNKTGAFGISHKASISASDAGHLGDNTLKITKDAVTYVHSGLIDTDTNIIYGYLQKAIKPFNQLTMMEDSMVIYRIARAPERRIFYVDTGNMSPKRSESYLRAIQSRYRNKIQYDAISGEIQNERRVMPMTEDYWLPRREGGKGTEITTLPGAQNLSDIDDINYFRGKLLDAVNVPASRFKEDSPSVILGQNTEISREELKFAKFITRLRTQFNELFQDVLKTQLILKKVIGEDDWNKIREDIQYDYLQDSYFTEAKQAEILKERVATANDISEMVGKYFSHTYVRKHILKQSDEEIKQIDTEIVEESKSDKYSDDMDESETENDFGADSNVIEEDNEHEL